MEEGRQGLQARQDARRHQQDRRRVLDGCPCSEIAIFVILMPAPVWLFVSVDGHHHSSVHTIKIAEVKSPPPPLILL